MIEITPTHITAAAIILISIIVIWIVYYVRKKRPFEKTTNGSNIFQNNLYFDNNGTTQPHKEVVDAMASSAWLGNASPDYAEDARVEIEMLKFKVREWLGDSPNNPKYKVIITSGASESNNLIIRGMVSRYWLDLRSTDASITGPPAHIVMSTIEHKTSIKCAEVLEAEGRAIVTYVAPNTSGQIDPIAVEAAIQPNTVLVSIMNANNELGTKNQIDRIGPICRQLGVPFHSDIVQTFGKYNIPLDAWGISAVSMSFHKMNGPQGLGLLVVDNQLADLVVPQIAGSQNHGLRGGTENIMAIAGANKAMDITLNDRMAKNDHMRSMKEYIVGRLAKHLMILHYREFANQPEEFTPDWATHNPGKPWPDYGCNNMKSLERFGIVFLGPTTGKGLPVETMTLDPGSNEINGYTQHSSPTSGVLPNTLMFSLVKFRSPTETAQTYNNFCNIKLRRYLLDRGAIVSIGSACNATSKNTSHVLKAIQAPFSIRCGVIRVSLGDYNTMDECNKLCDLMIQAVLSQC